jgi:hypothetical protein
MHKKKLKIFTRGRNNMNKYLKKLTSLVLTTTLLLTGSLYLQASGLGENEVIGNSAFDAQIMDADIQAEMRAYFEESFPDYDFTGYVFIRNDINNPVNKSDFFNSFSDDSFAVPFSSPTYANHGTWEIERGAGARIYATWTGWMRVWGGNIFFRTTLDNHRPPWYFSGWMMAVVPNLIPVQDEMCSLLQLTITHRFLPGAYMVIFQPDRPFVMDITVRSW